MNWIKVIHLKNGDEVVININMSFEEVIEGIHEELNNDFTIEVRCTNE